MKKKNIFVGVEGKSGENSVGRNKTVNKNVFVGSRGQAAIFDGIMFLLFSSVSVAIIFVFLNGYGISQDNAMRSAYVQAYLQDAAKSLFYMDVRTLSGAATQVPRDEEILWRDPNAGFGQLPCPESDGTGCPYWDLRFGPDPNERCEALGEYFSTTVADLVKRDLSDSDAEQSVSIGGTTGTDNSALVCLDNHFGLKQGGNTPCELDPICAGPTTASQCPVPSAHGKTALRCALKEVMKPLHSAGYYYFVEVTNRIPAEHSIPLSHGTRRITNYWPANEGQWQSCDDVVQKGYSIGGTPLRFQVLTVAMPFRVPRANTMADMRDFILKICVWPGKN